MRRVAAIRPPAQALATASIVLASIGFYASFVARTTVEYRGKRYFTLFDDAMVSMQYARNLANGAGLVWNAGDDRVEGYTNLLWTLWLAVLHAAGIPEAKMGLAVAASGAAILVATALVARRIVVEMGGSNFAASVAAAVVASFFPLLYWTLRGLEVGLVTLLTATAILLALRAHRDGVVLLVAVIVFAVLTRDDAAIPCVVIAAYAVVASPRELRWRRSLLLLGGSVAGTIVLHTAFRLWYYGEPLPNTYYLKLGGIDPATRLTRGLEALAEVGLLTLVVPTAMAVAVIASSMRERFRGAALLAGVFAVCCAYSVYVGGDAFETTQYANRFLTPGVVALLILAALFVDAARSAASWRVCVIAAALIAAGCAVLFLSDVNFLVDGTPPVGLRAVVVGLMTLALLGVLLATHARPRLRTGIAGALAALLIVAVNGRAYQAWWNVGAAYAADDRTMTRYGLLLRDSTAARTTIAVTWAGSIPYYSHRRAIDLLGKSDAHIAHTAPKPVAFRPGHNKWDYAYSIGRLRPDVVAQLFGSAAVIRAQLKAWGYEPIAGRAWVRRDVPGIDRHRLSRFLAHEYGSASRG